MPPLNSSEEEETAGRPSGSNYLNSEDFTEFILRSEILNRSTTSSRTEGYGRRLLSYRLNRHLREIFDLEGESTTDEEYLANEIDIDEDEDEYEDDSDSDDEGVFVEDELNGLEPGMANTLRSDIQSNEHLLLSLARLNPTNTNTLINNSGIPLRRSNAIRIQDAERRRINIEAQWLQLSLIRPRRTPQRTLPRPLRLPRRSVTETNQDVSPFDVINSRTGGAGNSQITGSAVTPSLPLTLVNHATLRYLGRLRSSALRPHLEPKTSTNSEVKNYLVIMRSILCNIRKSKKQGDLPFLSVFKKSHKHDSMNGIYSLNRMLDIHKERKSRTAAPLSLLLKDNSLRGTSSTSDSQNASPNERKRRKLHETNFSKRQKVRSTVATTAPAPSDECTDGTANSSFECGTKVDLRNLLSKALQNLHSGKLFSSTFTSGCQYSLSGKRDTESQMSLSLSDVNYDTGKIFGYFESNSIEYMLKFFTGPNSKSGILTSLGLLQSFINKHREVLHESPYRIPITGEIINFHTNDLRFLSPELENVKLKGHDVHSSATSSKGGSYRIARTASQLSEWTKVEPFNELHQWYLYKDAARVYKLLKEHLIDNCSAKEENRSNISDGVKLFVHFRTVLINVARSIMIEYKISNEEANLRGGLNQEVPPHNQHPMELADLSTKNPEMKKEVENEDFSDTGADPRIKAYLKSNMAKRLAYFLTCKDDCVLDVQLNYTLFTLTLDLPNYLDGLTNEMMARTPNVDHTLDPLRHARPVLKKLKYSQKAILLCSVCRKTGKISVHNSRPFLEYAMYSNAWNDVPTSLNLPSDTFERVFSDINLGVDSSEDNIDSSLYNGFGINRVNGEKSSFTDPYLAKDRNTTLTGDLIKNVRPTCKFA